MNSSTMRAVGVIPDKREVRLLQHATPNISTANEVRVRTIEVGICGTDREICTFVYGSPPEGSEYLVLGHESLGEVVEVGAAVTRFKVGDLVVPSVRRPCPHDHCAPCRADLQDFCATGDFTERGIKLTHGFMTEYYVDEEQYLNFVPHNLRDVAVLVEPLTIAEKGLAQVWQAQGRLPWAPPATPVQERGKGRTAVVLGAGPVGLLGAMTFAINGFKTVVYSRSKTPNLKSELVTSLGLEYISSESVTPAQLANRLGNIDLVYEALGNPQIAFEVLNELGTNGVYVFTGIPAPEQSITIDGGLLMRNVVLKNQAIVGTVNADRAAFEGAIRDLGEFKKRWPQALASLITSRHRVDDFAELLLGKNTGIKKVIAFD